MLILLTLLSIGNTDAEQQLLKQEYQAHIRFLADDLLEGRDTAERGQKLAARYLATQLTLAGLEPAFPDQENPFYQVFDLKASSNVAEGISLRLGGGGNATRFSYGKDFDTLSVERVDQIKSPIVFVGYGLVTDSYDDYAGLDVTGKWVAILEGMPQSKENGVFAGLEKKDTYQWFRFHNARTAGAVGVIFLRNGPVSPRGASLSMNGKKRERKRLPTIRLALESREQFFGRSYKRFLSAVETIENKEQPCPFELKKRSLSFSQKPQKETRTTENVVAILPGSDPILKDEYVVVSAHYDHVGLKDGKIYNGADDNASGSSTLLMLADHLSKYDRRRSMIVLLLTGEEKGLWGSKYFVKNPIVPLEQIVANINIDMVGRNERHEMAIIPSDMDGATTMNGVAHKINEDGDHGFTFKTDLNRFHPRSDHYNFTKAGVPAVFFFSGTHEDYHSANDDWDRLDYDKMANFFGFLQEFVVAVLNDDQKPSFQKDESEL